MNILLAQLIGMAGVILMVGSMQFKTKKHIMLVQLIANILYAIQYTLLGAFSASSMNIIGTIRCLTIYTHEKKLKKPNTLIPILLSIITIIIGIINYKTYLSLIPLLISLSHTITAFLKNTKIYKITFLTTCIIWIYYNYSVKAFTCLIGNILEAFSTSISLHKTKKSQ